MGCSIDECIVRLLGEKVGAVVEAVFRTILVGALLSIDPRRR